MIIDIRLVDADWTNPVDGQGNFLAVWDYDDLKVAQDNWDRSHALYIEGVISWSELCQRERCDKRPEAGNGEYMPIVHNREKAVFQVYYEHTTTPASDLIYDLDDLVGILCDDEDNNKESFRRMLTELKQHGMNLSGIEVNNYHPQYPLL